MYRSARGSKKDLFTYSKSKSQGLSTMSSLPFDFIIQYIKVSSEHYVSLEHTRCLLSSANQPPQLLLNINHLVRGLMRVFQESLYVKLFADLIGSCHHRGYIFSSCFQVGLKSSSPRRLTPKIRSYNTDFLCAFVWQVAIMKYGMCN